MGNPPTQSPRLPMRGEFADAPAAVCLEPGGHGRRIDRSREDRVWCGPSNVPHGSRPARAGGGVERGVDSMRWIAY